jgi:tetratricopeptide (TPR) repeat protein
MKTKLILLFIVVFTQFTKAQQNNCIEKENQLSQYIVDKEYQKAFDVWNDLKTSCPKLSEKVYLLGNKVLQYNIELASSEEKDKTVRELIKLYDLYDKNFPENQNGNFEKRGMALFDNKVGTNDEIYNYLDQAFNLQKKTFENPQAIYTYFDLYYKKYKSEKKEISIEKLIAKYIDVNSLVEINTEKFIYRKEEYNLVSQGINSLMNNLLTCENLTPYTKQNYESNKTNIDWLSSIASALFVKCNASPIFCSVALDLYKLKPTSKSAYYLGSYNLSTANQEKAIEYFTESASLETDKLEKANTCYSIASIVSFSDKAKSQEMVFMAIENNPTNGAYYLFLANLYENAMECATNVNEKKAIYKLASNTVLKAAQVEPRLKQTAENRSKEYLKKVIFEGKNKPKPVKLGCWINQTVQF